MHLMVQSNWTGTPRCSSTLVQPLILTAYAADCLYCDNITIYKYRLHSANSESTRDEAHCTYVESGPKNRTIFISVYLFYKMTFWYIERLPYIIIYRSHTLLKWVRFLAHPVFLMILPTFPNDSQSNHNVTL